MIRALKAETFPPQVAQYTEGLTTSNYYVEQPVRKSVRLTAASQLRHARRMDRLVKPVLTSLYAMLRGIASTRDA